jgi:hypothetical protein
MEVMAYLGGLSNDAFGSNRISSRVIPYTKITILFAKIETVSKLRLQ